MSGTYRNPPEREGGGCVNGSYCDYVLQGVERDDGEYGDEFKVTNQEEAITESTNAASVEMKKPRTGAGSRTD